MLIEDILLFKPVSLKDNYLSTIRKSILVFGKQRQLLCFVEEIGEFLIEYKEHKHYVIKSDDPVFTEIIDVIIAIETIKDLYHITGEDLNKNRKPLGHFEDAETIMYKMIVGISHYDRNRITKEEFCSLLANVYTFFNSIFSERASWRAASIELDTKFEKFESQVKGLLSV